MCGGSEESCSLGGDAGPTRGSLGGEVSLEGPVWREVEVTQDHFWGICFCAGHLPLR